MFLFLETYKINVISSKKRKLYMLLCIILYVMNMSDQVFRQYEWVALVNVASALSVLSEKEIYGPIDAIGDALSPSLRVEALRRALRMIISENPEKMPTSEDVKIIINLLLDEKRGKLAGSILASFALSKTSVKSSEEKRKEVEVKM
jgi:hypothetical protein